MGNKPPLSRADTVTRTEAGYRATDGNIAAIDFGTTSVSLAYTTKGDKEISTLTLDTKAKALRILNVILIKKEVGEDVSVTAFGGDARKRFTQLRTSEYKNYIYFERIKMLMKREEAVTRETLVESFSGEKFYLVEVIAFILKYLKDQLIDHLSRTIKPLKTTDFDWVITVPAIWDARGKRMMREAAYLAGLLSESGHIHKFTSTLAGPSSLPVPHEVNPDKLTLALEPESAALYSQENVVEDIKRALSYAAVGPPSDYMVIDIGGGTVDITAHAEVDDGIVVQNIPTGNAWGGTQVNEAFSQLLQKLVRDPGYKRFEASGNTSKQKAIVNSILYDEFEGQKISFGQGKIQEIVVDLPKFAAFYDKELKEEVAKKDGIEYEDDALYIDKEVVESQLFGPALDGIIKCTLEAIENTEHKVNMFYLVGGFGGCNYVHEKITAAKDEVYQSPDNKSHVIVPKSPQIAVAQGAVMWRKNPEKIKARRVDATYGIAVSLLFNPDDHDEHYKFFNEEEKKDYCNQIFSVFLLKGELAKAEELVTIDLAPLRNANTQMSINIYSTTKLGVQYVADKRGNRTVTKIGQLVIDIPNPDNLPTIKRIVDVTMDFSGTEIQAKAKYRVTGKEVKTVCDFLTAQ